MATQPAIRIARANFPCIDLTAYQEGQEVIQLQALKDSLSTYGFLVVKNALVSREILAKCYELGRQFFQLDDSIKQQYAASSIDQKKYGNIGYYSYLKEQAVSSAIPDLKEFIHIGPLDDTVVHRQAFYANNRWPLEIQEFQLAHEKLYSQFLGTAKLILEMIGKVYDLDKNYLEELTTYPNSILRSIHYPAVDNVLAQKGALRAAPHTGINLIGLQPSASSSGLQFFTPDEKWVYLDQKEFQYCISVNMSEMMEFITSGEIKPTLHQVVNEQDDTTIKSRYAIVFFMHPDSSMNLIPKRMDENYQSTPAGEWLLERLKDIKISYDA